MQRFVGEWGTKHALTTGLSAKNLVQKLGLSGFPEGRRRLIALAMIDLSRNMPVLLVANDEEGARALREGAVEMASKLEVPLDQLEVMVVDGVTTVFKGSTYVDSPSRAGLDRRLGIAKTKALKPLLPRKRRAKAS